MIPKCPREVEVAHDPSAPDSFAGLPDPLTFDLIIWAMVLGNLFNFAMLAQDGSGIARVGDIEEVGRVVNEGQVGGTALVDVVFGEEVEVQEG